MLTAQVQFPDAVSAVAAVEIYNLILRNNNITAVSLSIEPNDDGALVTITAPIQEWLSHAVSYLESYLLRTQQDELISYLRVLGVGDMHLYS